MLTHAEERALKARQFIVEANAASTSADVDLLIDWASLPSEIPADAVSLVVRGWIVQKSGAAIETAKLSVAGTVRSMGQSQYEDGTGLSSRRLVYANKDENVLLRSSSGSTRDVAIFLWGTYYV